MEMLVFILYCVLSYWAVGQTIYANKIQIGSMKEPFEIHDGSVSNEQVH